MAITAAEYEILKSMKGWLDKPRILEIGESVWYGDVPAEQIEADWNSLVGPDFKLPADKWTVAKCIYKIFTGSENFTAVDLHGSSRAIKANLNEPQYFGQFDLVVNAGTAEHVFDIKQCLENIHNATAKGGYIIHSFPFTGWYNHGFYNVNPTFFYDLAFANKYEIKLMMYSEITPPVRVFVTDREHWNGMFNAGYIRGNSLIHCVYKRIYEAPFAVPMQDIYDNPSAKAKEAWLRNR